ncbi:polysaccharide biosynthesis C-terminal domain-containing protein [Robiginitalea sp. SC105]|uniref:oligosaccharide flippase family protein n=1 Tax=Robiginitalea sp. SC105 TaxID=2762332 RepID=UPI00163A6340|nr:polysaccharide biosynthesis C-terminal domain-containing protein [Robiginitalea sp. SC105]MBC2840670.1 polysaccharide biosynthesis C-terminal domain-containing protein [Robiginitalea sp. SC105]
MGIILRQSIVNTVLTYIGFGLGAINTLFLYTRFMSDTYFGLVGVILSTGALLMPIMAFGIPNTLIKFFAANRTGAQKDPFLTRMLLLPLVFVVPLAIFSWLANSAIGSFLARENAVVGDYVWHIFIIGLAMAYFEIFFSWSKVCLRSAFGTFIKEVFVRLGITLLLLMFYLELLTITGFLRWLVFLYVLRCLVMALYALRLMPFRIRWQMPRQSREITVYSALILLGGSVSVLLLEVDRFMINQYIEIENVAYYTVAVFIATVIIVPLRAMHQITYPITAELLHSDDREGLGSLYRRSSLALLVVAGLIYLLILLNLDELYQLLPASYRGGFAIVVLIGAARVFDSFLGINAAILYNSRYYRTLLAFGIGLVAVTVGLNMWMIPEYGLIGAAWATLISISAYNLVKLVFVRIKFGLVPWSAKTFRLLGVGILTGILFYWLSFPFHPLVNITLKSLLTALFYLGLVHRLGISGDALSLLGNSFKKTDPGKKNPPRGPDN